MSTLRSDIAWSTAEEINVRGHNLADDVLGRMSLADFSFLQLTGRPPTPEEGRVYDAILVTLVEHGLTPSALAARLTYIGAPEALQAAVAAGLCGLGSVFVGSTETSARMMTDVLPLGSGADVDGADGVDLDELARSIVAGYREQGGIVPGIGHPIHKPVDPRAPRLFEIARETGFDGRYVALIGKIADEASRSYGKDLPVNATGAIGALASELGFPWRVIRGFGVMARAIGLVGHLLEESEQPLAREVWVRTEHEATSHARPGGGA